MTIFMFSMFSVSIPIRTANLFLPLIFFELFCCKPDWVVVVLFFSYVLL